MIFEEAILEWRENVPWPEDVQVEQDLILARMIQSIYSDDFLASKLAFRGGTCLNKLFWSKPVRYSEDLDFVQIKGEDVGPTIKALRKKLDPLFETNPGWERRNNSFRLHYSFQPAAASPPRKIKIEMNTREHFALEGFQKRPFHLKSLWHSGDAVVTTYTIDELLATKLRALYQRRKGRDLFDLWKSQELKPKWDKVVPMFLKYMGSVEKPIHRGLLFENLQEKLNNKSFQNDIKPLIAGGDSFDYAKAADFIGEKIFSLIPESKTKMKKKRYPKKPLV